jgi:murein tripeptide amidase MpaA
MITSTGLHAREWIAPATATYILLQLVEFQEDHEHLLDKYNWYILPVANPDGYEYSHTKDRLWRKSRHQTQRCRGVDLNRNFGFQWSSSKGCREDYSGTEAFSEPETKAIRDYILSNKNIKAYLSLHSYSQMWLLPWGYTTEKPKDYYEMYLPAEQAVEAIKSVRGTDYLLGTPSELIYTSTGNFHKYNVSFYVANFNS